MASEVERAASNRLIFIGGDEDFLRRRFLRQVLDLSGITPDDFDFESFLADSRPPMDWVASASTTPFMGERRTVVVRQVLRVDPKEFPNFALPETARLILVADEESGGDDKQRRLGTLHKNWDALVKKLKGASLIASSDSKQTPNLIRDEAKALGKQMSMPAANLLVEITGGSLTRCLEEIEKLAAYVGDRDTIKESDIRLVATPSREWNVYNMVDAAIAGNTGDAIRQLRILTESATKADEAAQRAILPALIRQFRLIWQARVAIEGGGIGVVREQFPDRPSLATEAHWSSDRAMRNAKKLTRHQIQICFQLIADADSRLKGALPAYTAMETLERLLLGIVDTIQGRTAA